jgi:hypothetical protein
MAGDFHALCINKNYPLSHCESFQAGYLHAYLPERGFNIAKYISNQMVSLLCLLVGTVFEMRRDDHEARKSVVNFYHFR